MADPIRVLSLFSGIGGLDLGVRAVLPESRVVGYVERDAYAASVLLARMEDAALDRAPVWCGDIAEFPVDGLGRVDMVIGGYPCQPFSVAGKRAGADDERHLWPYVAAVLERTRPAYAFLENVPGHLRIGFSDVLGDLADLGFDAEWGVFSASEVGAPHRRERLFILARRVSDAHGSVLWPEQGRVEPGRPGASVAGDVVEAVAHAADDHRRSGERGEETGARPDGERRRGSSGGSNLLGHPPWPPGPADADGWRCWLDAGGPPPAMGNPDEWRCGVGTDEAEHQREALRRRQTAQSGRRSMGDTPVGEEGDARSTEGRRENRPDEGDEVESRVCGDVDEPPDRLDPASWMEFRTDRLRCLGNAVVPACAELALRTLLGRLT